MSLPLVLCSVGEESAMPSSLLKILEEHFTVIPLNELDTTSAHLADQIVAIFNIHGKPKVKRYSIVIMLEKYNLNGNKMPE